MVVRIEDEFDLDKIVYSGQCFRPRKLSDGSYFFITGREYLIISQSGVDLYEVSCDDDTWNNVWVDYFDLNTNYTEVRRLIDADDSFMIKSGQAGIGIRILRQDKWEMLISYIISQRKSIPAIRTAVEKLCCLYGEKLINIDGEDVYSFPDALMMADATVDELATCGVGYRAAYIMDAVRCILDGRIDLTKMEELGDEELFLVLKQIHGVGDKVANCVSLFGYHRIGRAPVDTWILKVINEIYDGNNPFDRYGRYAGIMQQYVFYYVQHIGGLN